MIKTATGSSGGYLTDASGRAVYLWLADHGGHSACAGTCAAAWPPLITRAAPQAQGAAMAADLGTVKRSDGSLQVTYAGHPLYYFAGDSGPGQVNGEGSNGFGAKWWLVAPSGAQLTTVPSSSVSPSSSGSSTPGGYHY